MPVAGASMPACASDALTNTLRRRLDIRQGAGADDVNAVGASPRTDPGDRSTRTGKFRIIGSTTVEVVNTMKMAMDTPLDNSHIGLTIGASGWAINTAAASGTGVDTVHVWAIRSPGGEATLLGANYGQPRPDVAAVFGSQFMHSGFNISGVVPATGTYQVIAYAHDAALNEFTQAQVRTVIVESQPHMAIDAPTGGSILQPFVLSGWAIDAAAATGTGVDYLDVWAYPNPGSNSPAVFVGRANYGLSRPDVGSLYGSRFAPSGFTIRAFNLAPGLPYQLVAYVHSTVAGFNQAQTVNVTVTGSQVQRRPLGDMDGDHKVDVAVFSPPDG